MSCVPEPGCFAPTLGLGGGRGEFITTTRCPAPAPGGLFPPEGNVVGARREAAARALSHRRCPPMPRTSHRRGGRCPHVMVQYGSRWRCICRWPTGRCFVVCWRVRRPGLSPAAGGGAVSRRRTRIRALSLLSRGDRRGDNLLRVMRQVQAGNDRAGDLTRLPGSASRSKRLIDGTSSPLARPPRSLDVLIHMSSLSKSMTRGSAATGPKMWLMTSLRWRSSDHPCFCS